MKKKILMIGPARGHNIQRYLDVFQKDSDEYVFSFANYHPGREFEQKNFPAIEIFNVWNIPKLLFRLLQKNHIVWIHMFTPIPLIFFILLFRNRSSVINFNIWGESIPRKAIGKGFSASFYRFIMRYVDHVMCPWYATYNIIMENIPGVNAFVHPMGMNGEFFDLSARKDLNPETKNFLNQLPPDKIKFYFPKSFSKASDHDLIVEACNLLINKGVTNFVVYFWMGNQLDKTLENAYRKKIRKYNLEQHILVIHHSYLPTYDIQFIWKQMDAGLQIAIFDLLSTTILEPMYLEKEFIATDIAPYRIIEEKYNVNLDLMPLNAEYLSLRMEKIIKGDKTDPATIQKRKEVTMKNFNTYVNIPSIINYLISRGRKNKNQTTN